MLTDLTNFSEKVLYTQSSLWLSNTGQWLAYLKLNNSKITTLSYPDVENDNSNENEDRLRYAKVSLRIASIGFTL